MRHHPKRQAVAIAARLRRRERAEQRIAWFAFAAATTGAFVLMLLPHP